MESEARAGAQQLKRETRCRLWLLLVTLHFLYLIMAGDQRKSAVTAAKYSSLSASSLLDLQALVSSVSASFEPHLPLR